MQIARSFGLLALGALSGVARAQLTYQIEVIADTRNDFSTITGQGRASIASNGHVSFRATLPSGARSLYLWDGMSYSQVSTPGSDVSNTNQISHDGRVLAWGERDSFGQRTIHRMVDGVVTLIYDVPGDVVFNNVIAASDGSFAYAGSAFISRVSPIGDTIDTIGLSDDLRQICGIPGMNDHGTMGFIGSLDSVFAQAVWRGSSPFLPPDQFDPAQCNADINNDEVVAFTAFRPGEDAGVYSFDGTTLRTLVEPWSGLNNSLRGSEGGLAINNAGDVALILQPSATESAGLWVLHPNGTRSLVFQPTILPGEIFSAQLGDRSFGPGGLSDSGQLVFTYAIRSDTFLAIATPIPAPCPADLTGSSDPNDPSYAMPDGDADGDDFFFYLDAFATTDLAVCDLTGSSDPNDPSFDTPDGDCDGDDFFRYLDLFAAGCN
ncbi:MAG: GC-type dockerin domain-anchored protein [Phycisphaerales bacterium JB037]